MIKINKHKIKIVLLISAAFLLVSAGVLVSTAWLIDFKSVTNTFQPGYVASEVVETYNGTTKSNVSIKNVSNIDTYIRVALVPIWRNPDGSGTDLPAIAGTKYTIVFSASSDWVLGNDGFYYCKSPIAPGANTPVFINSVVPTTFATGDYAGKQFELTIISSAIQATPTSTVTSAWGVAVAPDGKLNPPV